LPRLQRWIYFDGYIFDMLLEIMRSKRIYTFTPEFVLAVLYLMEKGITRTTEIAKRLDAAPSSVATAKQIIFKLMERLEQEEVIEERRVYISEPEEEREERQVDILELLGIKQASSTKRNRE